MKRAKKKQYVIFGLGRFGRSVARALVEHGQEVLAIDQDEEQVQEAATYVTEAMQADATDESVLRSIGIGDYDVAIISMGASIEDSILIAMQCKEAGVPMVISKANDDLHAKILTKVGVDRVVFPERDMGQRLARSLTAPKLLDMMDLPDGYEIAEVAAPSDWQGKTLAAINVRKVHNISVLAIHRGESFQVSPGADSRIEPGDLLLLLGLTKDITRLEER